jgi:hypothetical protein
MRDDPTVNGLVLATHVSAGEVDKVKNTLPAGIRALWPEEVAALSL